ncbi:hypothetical protein D9758_010901 [Tetrapyrgos nigripes]|uniref:Uncharacterized protein n=1 Tax=Tetrapyrgos nigripes TaxID=182062 RepID=A0A8H5CUM2_9AGAR|nr:hypothetical protein D9758_010901 [Tetrapyrgos nigripes]
MPSCPLSFISETSPETSTSSNPSAFPYITPSFSPAPSPSASAPIGDRSSPLSIILLVVGGLVFLILCTFEIEFIRRRRKRIRKFAAERSLADFDVQPFISPIGVPVVSPAKRGTREARALPPRNQQVTKPRISPHLIAIAGCSQWGFAPAFGIQYPRNRRETDGDPFAYEESESGTVVLLPEYDQVFGNGNENGGETHGS